MYVMGIKYSGLVKVAINEKKMGFVLATVGEKCKDLVKSYLCCGLFLLKLHF